MCPYCKDVGFHRCNQPVPIFDRLFVFIPCVCKGGLDSYAQAYKKSKQPECILGLPLELYLALVKRCTQGDKEAQAYFDKLKTPKD